MKKIEVTAVFYPNGDIRPVQFTWQDRIFHIQAAGRQWQEGDHRHFLVMVDGERMFELIFSTAEAGWSIGRQPTDQWTV
jgi:hypothetical protein